MHDLHFGLCGEGSPYVDRGCFEASMPALGPAGLAAQLRDGHVCGYCGFFSRKYQRCVGPATERADDLTTACIFCEQVLHVDLVPNMRSGILIWLPEMTQAALNRSMPELYVRRLKQDSVSDGARDIVARLQARRELAKSEFGSDEPEKLVDRLRRARPGEAARLMREGLRLLPLDRRIIRDGDLTYNEFPQSLAYWRCAVGPLEQSVSQSFTDFELGLVAV